MTDVDRITGAALLALGDHMNDVDKFAPAAARRYVEALIAGKPGTPHTSQLHPQADKLPTCELFGARRVRARCDGAARSSCRSARKTRRDRWVESPPQPLASVYIDAQGNTIPARSDT
jgi:hypothetical protein